MVFLSNLPLIHRLSSFPFSCRLHTQNRLPYLYPSFSPHTGLKHQTKPNPLSALYTSTTASFLQQHNRVMVSESEVQKMATIKFLCSYGGKILPRSGDGKLRYVGGLIRVLAVDRSISFAEMMVKLVEFCGFSVELKCLLPNGDFETLVSVKSDEELAFLIEEYDRCSPGSKIKAVLFPPKSLKVISPPPSTPSSTNLPPGKRSHYNSAAPSPIRYPVPVFRDSGIVRYDPRRRQGNPRAGGGLYFTILGSRLPYVTLANTKRPCNR